MRRKFLGEEFWLRKMLMFNETRANIIKDADGSANKAVRTEGPTVSIFVECGSSRGGYNPKKRNGSFTFGEFPWWILYGKHIP